MLFRSLYPSRRIWAEETCALVGPILGLWGLALDARALSILGAGMVVCASALTSEERTQNLTLLGVAAALGQLGGAFFGSVKGAEVALLAVGSFHLLILGWVRGAKDRE